METAVAAVYRRDRRSQVQPACRSGGHAGRRGGRRGPPRGVALRTPLLAFGDLGHGAGGPTSSADPPSGSRQRTCSPSAPSRSAVPTTRSPSSHRKSAPPASSPTPAATTPRAWREPLACWGCRPSSSCPATRRPSRSRAFAPTAPGSSSWARTTRSASARADELAQQHGMALVPSFDDARIVAGQGTLGLGDRRAAGRDGRTAG